MKKINFKILLILLLPFLFSMTKADEPNEEWFYKVGPWIWLHDSQEWLLPYADGDIYVWDYVLKKWALFITPDSPFEKWMYKRDKHFWLHDLQQWVTLDSRIDVYTINHQSGSSGLFVANSVGDDADDKLSIAYEPTGTGNSADYSENDYPRSAVPDARVSDWGGASGFQFLKTYQFEQPSSSSTLDSGAKLKFTNPTNYKCARVFYKDKQTQISLNQDFQFVGSQAGLSITTSTPLPIHLTFILFDSDDCSNATPLSNLPVANDVDKENVYAAWISNKPTVSTSGVHYKFTSITPLTIGALPLSTASKNAPVQPQWRLLPESATTCDGTSEKCYLAFTGTLYEMAEKSTTQGAPINIEIPLGVDVQFPLTSEYVAFPVSTSVSGFSATECTNALATYNKTIYTGSSTFPTACGLNPKTIYDSTTYGSGKEAYERSFTYSTPIDHPIYVGGLGRIDGEEMSKITYSGNSRPCTVSGAYNNGSISMCDTTTADAAKWVEYAQWRINTSMLGLSSGHKPSDHDPEAETHYQGGEPAIQVSGITVSRSPQRNRSVVQLNVAQFGQGNPYNANPAIVAGRAADNQPVKVNDFKQVGLWVDATDGPDIGSDHSWMQDMYFHINDDSVKIEAQWQYYKNSTLLQGGVGGIMLGMYGVTRDGVNNSLVQGVYVPRLTQEANSGSWNAYSATHGLISTRTCPRAFQSDPMGTTSASLSNATIQNVKLFALANDTPVNTLASLVSVGVAADSIFCSTDFDTGVFADRYTFGPIYLLNIVSDVEPAYYPTKGVFNKAFVVYNVGTESSSNVTGAFGTDPHAVSIESNKYNAVTTGIIETYNAKGAIKELSIEVVATPASP